MKQNTFVETRWSESLTWLLITIAALWTLAASLLTARADETCSSPYLARIEGQEEFVYVWTLGVEGMACAARNQLMEADRRFLLAS